MKVIIKATGGTTFNIYVNDEFMGSMEYGHIDDGGQYIESDAEVIAYAIQEFGITADHLDAVVE